MPRLSTPEVAEEGAEGETEAGEEEVGGGGQEKQRGERSCHLGLAGLKSLGWVCFELRLQHVFALRWQS